MFNRKTCDCFAFSKFEKTMYIGQDFSNSSILKNLGPLSCTYCALQGVLWIFIQRIFFCLFMNIQECSGCGKGCSWTPEWGRKDVKGKFFSFIILLFSFLWRHKNALKLAWLIMCMEQKKPIKLWNSSVHLVRVFALYGKGDKRQLTF